MCLPRNEAQLSLQKRHSQIDDVLRKVSNKLNLDTGHVAGIHVKQLWFIFTDNSLPRLLDFTEIIKRHKVRSSNSQRLEEASVKVVPKGRNLKSALWLIEFSGWRYFSCPNAKWKARLNYFSWYRTTQSFISQPKILLQFQGALHSREEIWEQKDHDL